MPRPERALVALSALIFAGIGLATLIDPVRMLADVGVSVVDARGVVELRAMYGGLELGMAAFLGWTLAAPERVRAGLVASTLSIGGLGLARLGSWLIAMPEGWLLPLLCAVELGGALAGAILLWRTRAP